MIILGGEPPIIEQPEPRFGDLLKNLNELTYKVQEVTYNYNSTTQQKISDLTTNLNAFISEVINPINAHIAKKGPTHGETKATIGLDKKDNFRAATIVEHVNYSSVNAFVTPAGAKAAVDNKNASFAANSYQQMDFFPFSAGYFPYELVNPVNNQEKGTSPYLASVPHLMSYGDRIIFSDMNRTNANGRGAIFLSSPITENTRLSLSNIQMLGPGYPSIGWNVMGCKTLTGRFALFRPLPEKAILDYADALTLSSPTANTLLYRGFGNQLYKGLAVAFTKIGESIDIYHHFFQVTDPNTNPTVSPIVYSNYRAYYDLMSGAPYEAALNYKHQINFRDYVTVDRDTSVYVDVDERVSVTPFWNVQDVEIYLHIAIPYRVVKGGVTKKLVLEVIHSIKPGTLAAGGNALVTEVGIRTKDTLGADLLPQAGSTRVSVNDPHDLLNPCQSLGVMTSYGEIIKANNTLLAMHVKRCKTPYANLRQWLLAKNRPKLTADQALKQTFAPTRASSFGILPERIIPYSDADGVTTYLVYTLNPSTGEYEWQERRWNNIPVIGNEGASNINYPSTVVKFDTLKMPKGISSVGGVSYRGFNFSSLVFNKANDFKAPASLTYANGSLALGTTVTLHENSLTVIQQAANGVLVRAKTALPTINDSLREAQIQVYRLTAVYAVVFISDGVAYAEAGVAKYSISANKFILDFTQTNGLKLSVVSVNPSPIPAYIANANSRTSISHDGPRLDYSDLVAMQEGSTTYHIVINRAFGFVYGDLGFRIDNITGASPSIYPRGTGKTNYARLYSNTKQIDVAEEIYPAFIVPNDSIYATDGSVRDTELRLFDLRGVKSNVVPFKPNDGSFFMIPAGSKYIIRGRVFTIEETLFISTPNPLAEIYYYLVREGNQLKLISSPIRREISNNEIHVGGVELRGSTLTPVFQRFYIVLNGKRIDSRRGGSTIPAIVDDGIIGVPGFFKLADIIG